MERRRQPRPRTGEAILQSAERRAPRVREILDQNSLNQNLVSRAQPIAISPSAATSRCSPSSAQRFRASRLGFSMVCLT